MDVWVLRAVVVQAAQQQIVLAVLNMQEEQVRLVAYLAVVVVGVRGQ